jgi:hypothetical protein
MDEDLTGRTGDLIAGLAMFRDASVPAPNPELAALFSASASAALPTTPRRLPVYKRILAGIPSKVAAGALGALLAGSVGAGALTGTMMLTSHEDDAPAVETPAVSDEAPAAADDQQEAPEVEDGAAVAGVEDGSANDAAPAADLAAVPVPTSVSEAAHTHDFDEACGNHGHYVSAFARYGEEPECAVGARSDAAGTTEATSTSDSASQDAAVAGDSATTDASTVSAHKGGAHHSSKGKGAKGKGDR